ncbi:helix-turn-helix domain-containing protein [Streptomyces tubbatahanensis]|uniref:Helix-turn-helix domain-containing protein n=1 Tax=Streptomyces tubbatahanensis TaxID=2923272 RepID=A0ABY3Y1Z6_9ACTN|nr:helix-turn-helix domain-containing protein [Streptomyces tubbatahanensis]UNT00858.1 helix-turn-helix domain-containing protein [Streptomyces tubbatahanensis]
MARVHFRRRPAAEPLRRWVEHYWLIDWDLEEPYVSQVVPHPCVNLVFERRGPAEIAVASGLVAGVATDLFTTKLADSGRVCGVQFRPGGFHPFLSPPRPLTALRGRQLTLHEAFGDGGAPDEGAVGAEAPGGEASAGREAADSEAAGREAAGAREVLARVRPRDVPTRVLRPDAEEGRVAALDAFLLSLSPRTDPAAEQAMALADRIRTDRTVLRVERLAADEGVSVRTLQRLFATYVGVSPKWAILRYRVHEAMERATAWPPTDWAQLAGELGYSDQAHLVRDFTAAVGVTPTAYARAVETPPRPHSAAAEV